MSSAAPLWAGGKEGRAFTRIDITTMLKGATLPLPPHVTTASHPSAPDDLKRKNLALARAFGAPFVHENEFAGAASHYLNGRGIPAVNPEVGGAYLGPGNTRYYTEMMMNGLTGMMRHLGMLDGAAKPPKQPHFDLKARREVRPRHSGYLMSHFERPEDLGRLITGGTRLGEGIDLYSYQVLG